VERQNKELRRTVLLRAGVVACTLSAAGGELRDLLPKDAKFSALIIDEVSTTSDIHTQLWSHAVKAV